MSEETGTPIPGEVEAKARDMGWRPKEEWEGDDSGWMDAPDFIERQDKRRAVANEEFKAENEKLRAELSALKSEQQETRKVLDEFKGWRNKTEENAYKRALKDIQERQRRAVEEGDTAAFDAASGEIDTLVAESRKPVQERQVNPDEVPAYRNWQKDNKWYGKNYKLTAYANEIAPLIGRNEGLSGDDAEFYERITEEVRKEFPEAFENPNRKRQTVEGGGSPPPKKSNSVSSLPREAKEAGERFVREGLYKSLSDYAEDYFAQEEAS